MAIGSAVASIGLGVFSAIKADKAEQQRLEEIADFNRTAFFNPNEDIEINTIGTDKAREANLSRGATALDVIQRGGTRAIASTAPVINRQNIDFGTLLRNEIGGRAERRSFAIARGDERIQGLIERREENALLGLGQSLQNAREEKQSGIENIVRGLLMGTRADFGGFTPQVEEVSPLTPEGIDTSIDPLENAGVLFPTFPN